MLCYLIIRSSSMEHSALTSRPTGTMTKPCMNAIPAQPCIMHRLCLAARTTYRLCLAACLEGHSELQSCLKNTAASPVLTCPCTSHSPVGAQLGEPPALLGLFPACRACPPGKGCSELRLPPAPDEEQRHDCHARYRTRTAFKFYTAKAASAEHKAG